MWPLRVGAGGDSSETQGCRSRSSFMWLRADDAVVYAVGLVRHQSFARRRDWLLLPISPGSSIRSTGLPQHVLNRFRMLRDHRQKHSCGRVRVRSALFPVPQRGRRKAKLGRELRLAESHLQPDLSHINLRHVYQGYTYLAVLSLGPCDRLFQALNDALANSLPPPRVRAPLRRFGCLFHGHSGPPMPLSVPCYQRRNQALHRVPLGLTEVRLPVLGVRREQKHRQALVMKVVDHSCAAALAPSFQSPPDLPKPTALRDNFAGLRICSDERHQFRPLRIRHQRLRVSQELFGFRRPSSERQSCTLTISSLRM